MLGHQDPHSPARMAVGSRRHRRCSGHDRLLSDSADEASPPARPTSGRRGHHDPASGLLPQRHPRPRAGWPAGGPVQGRLDPLGIKVTPTVFNAGPDAVTALFSDSLDIAYVGPNPTINAWVAVAG